MTVFIVDCLNLWVRVGDLWDTPHLFSLICRFVCQGSHENPWDLIALPSSRCMIHRDCLRKQQAFMCNYGDFLAHLSNTRNWVGCMFLLIWLPQSICFTSLLAKKPLQVVCTASKNLMVCLICLINLITACLISRTCFWGNTVWESHASQKKTKLANPANLSPALNSLHVYCYTEENQIKKSHCIDLHKL